MVLRRFGIRLPLQKRKVRIPQWTGTPVWGSKIRLAHPAAPLSYMPNPCHDLLMRDPAHNRAIQTLRSEPQGLVLRGFWCQLGAKSFRFLLQ